MTSTQPSGTPPDGAESQCPFSMKDAPMARDRTEGWRYFRAAGEVFQDEQGAWYVTTPEAYRQVTLNTAVFSAALAFDYQLAEPKMIPLAIDPPKHSHYRRILDPMFGPRAVNKMEDELRKQAAALIDAFADKGEVEVISALCHPYPATVFLHLFGLPREDRDMLAGWVSTILGEGDLGIGEQTEGHAQAQQALLDYLRGFIEKKKENPGDDIISRILALQGEDAWTDNELLGMAFMITNGGLSTVRDTLAFVFYHLAKRPELRRQVAADLSLVDAVAEEVLRLEHAAPNIPRVSRADAEIMGKKIPAGSTVLMSGGCANRDPKTYTTPDDIDLAQAKQGHLTFGQGIHRCLGSHLARRELRIVVQEFLKRIPDFGILAGFEPHVRWPSTVLGLESLPLVWPASGQSAA